MSEMAGGRDGTGMRMAWCFWLLWGSVDEVRKVRDRGWRNCWVVEVDCKKVFRVEGLTA